MADAAARQLQYEYKAVSIFKTELQIIAEHKVNITSMVASHCLCIRTANVPEKRLSTFSIFPGHFRIQIWFFKLTFG